MPYVQDKEYSEGEIQEMFWEHDCHLSEEDSCEVCAAYYEAIRKPCWTCKHFPCVCDSGENANEYRHDL